MAKVKSAERTLRFLELLAYKRNGISFTDIQTGLDIPKSSTHSLIQEFSDKDFLIYNNDTKKYYAGLEYIKLCTVCIQNTDLLEELSILTSETGQELGLTTHAGVLDNRNILYLAKYENNSDLSLMHNIGLRIPAHCTAMGKMLLSQFSNEIIIENYTDYHFEKLTEKSIDNLNDLLSDLEKIREKGYAVEICEASRYTACIALPLVQQGKMVAAFSATLPIHLFETSNIEEIVSSMKKNKKNADQRLFVL